MRAMVLVCGLAGTARLSAHDLARSDSRLEVHGSTVDCQLTVDLLEFAGVDQDGNGSISYAELDRSIAAVFTRVKEHFVVRGPGAPARIVMTRHDVVDDHLGRLQLQYTFPTRVSTLEVTSTFDQLSRRPDYQHYVDVVVQGGEQRAVLDAANRTVTFDNRWWMRTSVWLTAAALLMVGLRVGWFVRSKSRATWTAKAR